MSPTPVFVHKTALDQGRPPSPWSMWKLIQTPFYLKHLMDEQRLIEKRAADWFAVSPPDRLSAAEVQELASYPWELYEQDIPSRREMYERMPVEETFQGQTVPLIRHVLANDPAVKSVVEIGCYYAYVCNVLAKEFPAVKVIGVDFPALLKKINADFTLPNLEIVPGYALELMEAEKLRGDLYFTCSTACRFKNKELKRYLELMKQHDGKYLIINEPLLPKPGERFVNPEKVSPNKSIPVVYKSSDPSMPPCFVHNYRKIVEQFGFSVVHYHVYIPKFSEYPYYRIEMVAKM